MADIVTKDVRSRMMSGIRGKDTKPEVQVRRYLHSRGFRYSLHGKNLPGKPDLVLSKYRAVVLVHGCFWHGHDGCRYAKVPSNRRDFWENKIRKTKERDVATVQRLSTLGWRVGIIWECALRNSAESSLAALELFLKSGQSDVEIAEHQKLSAE